MALRRIFRAFKFLRRRAKVAHSRGGLDPQINRIPGIPENWRGLVFKETSRRKRSKQLDKQESIFIKIRDLIGAPQRSEVHMRLSLGSSGTLYVTVDVPQDTGFKNNFYRIDNQKIIELIEDLYDLEPI